MPQKRDLPGVDPQELELVKTILFEHLPKLPGINLKVFVFGSRLEGHFRKDSDLDLLFESDRKLDLAVLSAIKAQFEESSLPYSVDILETQRIPADILASIQKLKKTQLF